LTSGEGSCLVKNFDSHVSEKPAYLYENVYKTKTYEDPLRHQTLEQSPLEEAQHYVVLRVKAVEINIKTYVPSEM